MSELAQRMASLSPAKRQLLKRQLAERGVEATARPEAVATIAGRARGVDPIPLSFAQERLWFFHRLAPEAALYNIHNSLLLRGRLRHRSLHAALREAARRHESLRTTIAMRGDEPVQVVRAGLEPALPRVDLAALPGDLRASVAHRLELADAGRGFDLEAGPPLRVCVLRLDRREHWLLLTVHHIVFDGWSLGVLLREIQLLYRSQVENGRMIALPPPLQYADFTLWQRERVTGALLEGQLAYWRRQLAGAPEALELPTDRPRAARRGFAGAIRRFTLPAELQAALRALCVERRMTLLVPLLAAFGALLARYTGQRDVSVGTPIANRQLPELDSLIGFVVNSLVLRLDLGADPSFAALLEQARRTTLDAYENQDVPFEGVVQAVNPERGRNRQPLFQVTLALQNQALGSLELPGLSLKPREPERPTEDLDLSALVSEEAEGLVVRLRYSTELFDATSVERLGRHFMRLLSAALADPEAPVLGLALLDRGQRHQLTAEWNDTEPAPASAAGRGATIHGRFTQCAAEAPEAVALSLGDAHLTYGELDRRSNRLARRLLASGMAPGELVGVDLDRGFARFVALLAILKAGGAYLPLDPSYPPARRRAMLEASAIERLLTSEDSRGQWRDDPVRLLSIDQAPRAEGSSGEERAGAEPDLPPPPAGGPGSVAYVLYTSGSTGKPKGVAVPHSAVLRLLAERRFDLGVEEGGRRGGSRAWLHAAPLAFDGSVLEIWPALLTGARLELMPPGRLSLEELGATIERAAISHLFLSTELGHQVIDEQRDRLLGVHRILFGGDVLSPVHVRRLIAGGLAPGAAVGNGYGPTENTVFTTLHMLREARQVGTTVAIGRPMTATGVYLVDGRMKPVELGVEGDLWTRGAGLAVGYLERGAATAAAFRPDPFATAPGQRLYRTGDRGKFLADGSIEFLGRRDHQVKVRGFRIELGEIETALESHPAVARAAVVYRHFEGLAAGKLLVAYVVAGPGLEPSAGELRGHLAERLPDHALPQAYEWLERIPLSANGKVDRAALPAPQRDEELAFVPPRTPTEEILAGIWSELLGVERVGATDGFFELGGHSLLATRIVSRVRRVLGVELELRDLFDHLTVAGLARRVEELEAGAGALPPIEPAPAGMALPLSYAQERLWLLDQVGEGDAAAYNVPVAARFEGRLDASALRAALRAVVVRHATLRSRFDVEEGRPVQRVEDEVWVAGAVGLPVVDLQRLSPSGRRAWADRLPRAEARRPFDLRRGPLLRTLLLRLAADRHLAVMNMHHIASDGWSMEILLREIGAFYRRRVTATPEAPGPAPAPLAVGYADFALWQRRWLRGEALAAELAHWRQRLAGLPPALDLPYDRPPPAEPGSRGAVRALRLDGALAERLRRLAHRRGATLFMVLLAVFQLLLARLSGQHDLAVGAPVAGRRRHEVEPLIGFFVNMLVLRCRADGASTFEAFLDQTRETALEAYRHEDLPFEKLVEALRPARAAGQSPLFQASFALQSATPEPLRLPGVELVPVALASEVAKFELGAQLWETPTGLEGVLEYRTDRFDATTAERMAAYYHRLLAAVADAPHRRLDDFDLLGRGERHQLLREWHEAPSRPLGDQSLGELFRRVARRQPEAPALESAGETISYGELEARSNRLAHYLRAVGAGREERVGLMLAHAPEMIVAMIAILKTGAAYVPLDPEFPPARLAAMIEDAGVRRVIVDPAARLELPAEILCVDLDAEARRIATCPATEPPAVGDGDSLAYVIFTSGSTGRPKGVEVVHRAVARLVDNPAMLAFGPEERMAHTSTPCFDLATLEIWVPLLSGAAVVLVPRGLALEPRAIADHLRRTRTTVIALPIAVLNNITAEEPAALSGVGQLLFGGETANPRAIRSFLAGSPPPRVCHAYGPTECTVLATWERVAAVAEDAATVPIGRPLAHTSLQVVDRGLRPVPAGVAGELLLGGPGLARGYSGRPAATAAAFIPDPWSRSPGARLYATGDWVRRLADGRIDFLGRRDNQVQVRGVRIELGEVEAAILALPQVREAAVVTRGEGGDRQLVAYVVPRPGSDLDRDRLRTLLADRLPRYLVPGVCLLLDALPLNAVGKLDRAALPSPAAGGGSDAEHLEPLTPSEAAMAAIWAQVLETEVDDREASFFELGGHSLLAVRLKSRLRQAFGVDLSPRVLFENPTLRAFSRRVEEARRRADPFPRPPIGPRDGAEPAPMSFAQQRLWTLHELGFGTDAYNIPLALELEGRLDPRALVTALGRIVERHDVLRTVFAQTGPRAIQIVRPFETFALPRVDLGALGQAARARLVSARIRAEERRHFDLRRGPLMAVSLLVLGPRRSVLLLSFHHVIFDGWSLGVLLRELEAFYRAARAGRVPSLPALPLQYADYASWQRRWLRAEVVERGLAYWRQALGSAPPLELPVDRQRGRAESFRGASCQRFLGPAETEALQSLSRQSGATLFMTLLAGWKLLLARWCGQSRVLVGTPVANRDLVEVEPLIGFFVNTLVLATSVDPRASGRRLLEGVREVILGAFAHQEMPFQKLVEELGVARDLQRSPLFQVLFVLQNLSLPRLELPELALRQLPAETTNAKFELSLGLYERDGGLAMGIDYNRDLFDATTAARLLGAYARVLTGLAARPDAPVGDLPLLAPAQRHQLLHEWSETRRATLDLARVDLGFERVARRAPEAVALVNGAGHLTYGAMDRRANRLARWLRRQGVGLEVPVATLSEASPALFVAWLAILKAGGAYVPLDPEHPRERLELILADAGARLVLADGELAAALPPGQGWEVHRLEALEAAAAGESAEAPACSLAPQAEAAPEAGTAGLQLAYVLYTSGSSGRPKGVSVSHQGIVRLVRGQAELAITADDVLLQVTRLSFDVSTYEIWGALLNGARLAFAPPARAALAELGAALQRHRVTTLWLTSGLFAVMVDGRLSDLRGLRRLIAGGDAVPVAQARRVIDALPETELVNGYGPTENTVFTTSHRASAATAARSSLPIGRPIGGSSAFVLDRALRPVPPGAWGELVSGGPGVARGYLRRPARTAEAFVPDGFAGEPGTRLYRTGDVVRQLADGTIEYRGRSDSQVKIRGYRIELGEIQAALAGHPSVAEAVVVTRDDPAGRRLVAYLVAAGQAEIEPATLAAHLRESLPAYMVPDAFVALPELPLTAAGKIDRRRLPDPEELSRGTAAGFVPPSTPLEKQIAALWSRALGREEIGVHDSFFDLGGHSLLVAQVANELSEALGRPLAPVLLFEQPTVAALARALEPGSAEGGEEAAVELGRERATRRRRAVGRRAVGRRQRDDGGVEEAG